MKRHMKKVIIVGFPDRHILKLTHFLTKSSKCDKIIKKYTYFQFFQDFESDKIDIIFLDSSTRELEIIKIGERIRQIDENVTIVGMATNKNLDIKRLFLGAVAKSKFIFKTENNNDLISNLLSPKTKVVNEPRIKIIKGAKTVLVVDDFVNTLNVIKYTLEKEGFKVITASSGMDALKLFKEENIKPDLIISDLNMPNMDGFELIKNIRKTADADGIPIFLLTTEFSFAKKIKAKELKINGWIQKPYNSKHFIKTITKALN